jgi:hypothetical protein
MITESEDISEIRRAVQALCAEFQGSYWREKDSARAYPGEFVDALTKAGFLAALIPEAYGGSGLKLDAAAVIMEEIQAAGCNGASAHAQMYIMNTLLKYGSEEQKQEYLPRIATGELRLQAFGVSEPTSGTDTLSLRTVAVRDGDDYVINGQKIWTSRAEYSDLMMLLARTTPREEVASKTEGLSIFLVDIRKVVGPKMHQPLDPRGARLQRLVHARAHGGKVLFAASAHVGLADGGALAFRRLPHRALLGHPRLHQIRGSRKGRDGRRPGIVSLQLRQEPAARVVGNRIARACPESKPVQGDGRGFGRSAHAPDCGRPGDFVCVCKLAGMYRIGKAERRCYRAFTRAAARRCRRRSCRSAQGRGHRARPACQQRPVLHRDLSRHR